MILDIPPRVVSHMRIPFPAVYHATSARIALEDRTPPL